MATLNRFCLLICSPDSRFDTPVFHVPWFSSGDGSWMFAYFWVFEPLTWVACRICFLSFSVSKRSHLEIEEKKSCVIIFVSWRANITAYDFSLAPLPSIRVTPCVWVLKEWVFLFIAHQRGIKGNLGLTRLHRIRYSTVYNSERRGVRVYKRAIGISALLPGSVKLLPLSPREQVSGESAAIPHGAFASLRTLKLFQLEWLWARAQHNSQALSIPIFPWNFSVFSGHHRLRPRSVPLAHPCVFNVRKSFHLLESRGGKLVNVNPRQKSDILCQMKPSQKIQILIDSSAQSSKRAV